MVKQIQAVAELNYGAQYKGVFNIRSSPLAILKSILMRSFKIIFPKVNAIAQLIILIITVFEFRFLVQNADGNIFV